MAHWLKVFIVFLKTYFMCIFMPICVHHVHVWFQEATDTRSSGGAASATKH